jgi:hypothetical protein
MSNQDLLLDTVETIYASGVDTDRIPAALEATNRLFGSASAILEVIDMRMHQHADLWSVGTPTPAEIKYVERFAAFNPRLPYAPVNIVDPLFGIINS